MIAQRLVTLISFLFILLCQETKFSEAFFNLDKVNVDSECMKAMCVADSGCTRNGCVTDTFGRLGCGYFRMNIWQFKQCYEPGRRLGEDSMTAWLRCSEEYECAAKCIKRVATRFRLKCYGKSDCETLARIHDGGANGCRSGATLHYWATVKGQCRNC